MMASAKPSSPSHHVPRRLAVLVLALALIALGLWIAHAAAALPSERQRAAQAAISYARSTTSWQSGPTAQSVRLVTLRHLGSTLRHAVPASLADDVNLPDLIRRYGPDRQVALVVLAGVFNTLPQDEGVVINGQVVAVVDAKSNRVLLLTD